MRVTYSDGDSGEINTLAKQAEKEKSFLLSQTPWLSVSKVAERANQREQSFVEDVEVKPPYGEEWRRMMWKMGSRERPGRGCRNVASSTAGVDMGQGSLDEHHLCQGEGHPRKHMARQPRGSWGKM